MRHAIASFGDAVLNSPIHAVGPRNSTATLSREKKNTKPDITYVTTGLRIALQGSYYDCFGLKFGEL